MKIAIIVHQLVVSGGTERQAIMLARELILRGHQATLYTFSYNASTCYPELLRGMAVVTAPKVHLLARAIAPDTDLLNPHEQAPLKVAAYFRRNIRRIPSVLMINDLYIAQWSLMREYSGKHFSPMRRAVQWCKDQYAKKRFFVGGADAVAVLNRGTQEKIAHYLGLESTVVRSGLDVSRFPFYARTLPQGRIVHILCHALFYRHRRFEDAIEALARLIRDGFDVDLTISGSYTHKKDARIYYQELQHKATELEISDRVVFVGAANEAGLVERYRNADIFLFPSHLQTWGLAVFEAMASGLPVVVSQSAGASEVLTDKSNALLSHPCSAESIANCLAALLRDRALYARLSNDGRAFVEREISWEKYTDAMLALYRHAIKKS